MRLIDADEAMQSIKNLMENGATIEQAIDAQPTAYDTDKGGRASDYRNIERGEIYE